MAYENVKKTLVFTLFSAFGSSWRAPSGVVFTFFRFPIVFTTVFLVSDRFFHFSDRIHDRFSVFDRFFCFFLFFSSFFVFFGGCFLGKQRKSAQTSGNQQRIIPGQSSELSKVEFKVLDLLENSPVEM